MQDFTLCRHGQSLNNSRGLVNGWSDSPLTPQGHKEAEQLSNKLQSLDIRYVMSSDLSRSYMTADCVSATLGLPKSERYYQLRERNWGIYENTPRINRPSIYSFPQHGESWEEFSNRIYEFLSSISLPDKTLIVAHAGLIKALHSIIYKTDSIENLVIPNCAMYNISQTSITLL